jgi:hypothetical protein
MLGRLRRAIAGWRERNRQYAVERALYKAGGGDEARGTRAASRYGPSAATHMPDVKDADEK